MSSSVVQSKTNVGFSWERNVTFQGSPLTPDLFSKSLVRRMVITTDNPFTLPDNPYLTHLFLHLPPRGRFLSSMKRAFYFVEVTLFLLSFIGYLVLTQTKCVILFLILTYMQMSFGILYLYSVMTIRMDYWETSPPSFNPYTDKWISSIIE